uniref:ATP synthase F0 subunit 8 n=1 Tax=Metacrangonyx repens TaxID=1199184 RepID=K7ZWJ8_9CRUS|nr:ATP synthase F0 subunit 8 [Metacrangonyx repens]CCI69410.1 ATP synthase F0 subunit 8 [Metacrangonyx repens]
MPQMAPSLWLIIYLIISFVILYMMSNMFFVNENKYAFDKTMKKNKYMKLMWQ